jgi:glucose-6-phosphate dehydrogenase assembly protein OpcA
MDAKPAVPGEPVMRWSTRIHSLEGIEAELGRIWASISLTTSGDDGAEERRVAARSSVMNLVVIAGRGETGERVAAIIQALTGRHPSRTIILSPADPDGPSWIDAQVQAHCILPSPDSPETCAELIYLTAGGETGQHLAGILAPLLVHDLPITLWWPGEPRFESRQATDLLAMADRVLVDGSSWAGDGLRRLAALATLPARFHVAVADFALLRQSRWREAIASSFDLPRLRPFLRSITEVAVTYAAHEGTPGMTNVVRPAYHLAWLAARLGWSVDEPLATGAADWSGYTARFRHGRRRIAVSLRPVDSPMPPGTTLQVDLAARRRDGTLGVQVTAQAEGVTVSTTIHGEPMTDRHFMAPRRRDGDLLAETIETVGGDPVSSEALAMAALLVGGAPPAGGPRLGSASATRHVA